MIMAEESIEAKEAGKAAGEEKAEPAQNAEQAAAQPAKKSPRRTSKPKSAPPSAAKKKQKGLKHVLVHAKRKEAVARASIKEGTGIVRINGFDINTFRQKELVSVMLEPIKMSDITSDLASRMDINVNVSGGGFSSQAQAARNAIAKGIIEYTGSESIRKLYASHSKYLLTDDYRRVEPKKYKGPKARARFQTSYR